MPGLFNFIIGAAEMCDKSKMPSEAALNVLVNERTGGWKDIKINEVVCISPYRSLVQTACELTFTFRVSIKMVDSLQKRRVFLVGGITVRHFLIKSVSMNPLLAFVQMPPIFIRRLVGVNHRSSSIVFDEGISKEAIPTSAYGGVEEQKQMHLVCGDRGDL